MSTWEILSVEEVARLTGTARKLWDEDAPGRRESLSMIYRQIVEAGEDPSDEAVWYEVAKAQQHVTERYRIGRRMARR